MKQYWVIFAWVFCLGCAEPKVEVDPWQEFSEKWKAAPTPEARAELIDISAVIRKFQNKTADEVKAVFGEPTFEGKNRVREYELQYDLEAVAGSDGKVSNRLTFVTLNNVVKVIEMKPIF